MNARFDILRDAELSAYPWRFAVKRTRLPASTDTPEWGFSYIYDRPVDDLRPIRVGSTDVNPEAIGLYYSASRSYEGAAAYEIIEGRIHTNLSAPLDYEYIAQITDTGQFDPLFTEALACRLAVDAAEELTQSGPKQDRAEREYLAVLAQARRVNSLYRPPRQRVTGPWNASRVI